MEDAVTWRQVAIIVTAVFGPPLIFQMAGFALAEWKHSQWKKWQRLKDETEEGE